MEAIVEPREERADSPPVPAGRTRLGSLCSYSYRVPHCVPYWEPRTYLALLRCALRGQVIEGPDVQRLAGRLARSLAVPAVIPCGSGRGAIEAALRAGGIAQGSEVVIPTFCCASIMPPVLAVGAVPVFADTGPDLNLTLDAVEAAVTVRTRAVIVPHLFGNPAPIDAIATWCRGRRIFVIDDAAQALGATLDGRPLGTLADAGVLSFGNGKVCFGTGGGALVARDRTLLDRAGAIRLRPGACAEGMRNALAVLLWRRWRRFTLPVKVALSRVMPGARRPRPLPGAMRNLDAAVALTLLDTLGANLSKRRERVAAYQQMLASEPGLRLIPHAPGSACLTQVVHVQAVSACTAAQIISTLRERGIEASRSFEPLHLSPAGRQYSHGPLPQAEDIWQDLVELPCEPGVSLSQVRAVAGTIRGLLH